MVWSTLFCIIAAIVLVIFAEPIVSLFGTDIKMIDLASKALRLNAALFITFGFQMVYASLYLSIGKSLVGGMLSLGRQGIFFFPLVFVLSHMFELTGVIWVQPMADFFTTILTVVFAIKINRTLLVKIAKEKE